MSKKQNEDNNFYVVIIKNKEERDNLKSFCIKHNIPLTYPHLFDEERIYHLWGINKSGVGLVGTVVANNTKEGHIIDDVEQLENVL